MNIINQNYQVSIFGDYADITPSPENIQFFLDELSDKGFIPNIQNEINLEFGDDPLNAKIVNVGKLRLSTSDSSFNIVFLSRRIDFILTNINFEVFEMPSFSVFVANCKNFLETISRKYPNKHRRIAVIQDFFIFGHDEVIQKKLHNNVSFFENKQLLEWAYSISVREKMADNEDLNITCIIKKANTQVLWNSLQKEFDGIHICFDANTIDENETYRFDNTNICDSIDNIIQVLCKASSQIFKYFTTDK